MGGFYKEEKKRIILVPLLMLDDETVANSIQKNTRQNIKRRNKYKGTKSEPKEQHRMWVNKGQRNK
jgi:hypothetical protein